MNVMVTVCTIIMVLCGIVATVAWTDRHSQLGDNVLFTNMHDGSITVVRFLGPETATWASMRVEIWDGTGPTECNAMPPASQLIQSGNVVDCSNLQDGQNVRLVYTATP